MAIGIPGAAPAVFFPVAQQGDFPPLPVEDDEGWWAGASAAFAPFILAASLAANSFSATVAQSAGNQDPPDFVSVPVNQGPAQGQFLFYSSTRTLVLAGRGTDEDFVAPVTTAVDDDPGLDGLPVIWPSPTQIQVTGDPSDFTTSPWDMDAGPSLVVWPVARTVAALAETDELPVVSVLDDDSGLQLQPLWIVSPPEMQPGIDDEIPTPSSTLGIDDEVISRFIFWSSSAPPPLILHQDETVTAPTPLTVDEDTPLPLLVITPDVVMVAPWSFGATEDIGGWTPEEQDWNPPVIWPVKQTVYSLSSTDELSVLVTAALDEDVSLSVLPLWKQQNILTLSDQTDDIAVTPSIVVDEEQQFAAVVWPVSWLSWAVQCTLSVDVEIAFTPTPPALDEGEQLWLPTSPVYDTIVMYW